jgi:monothiol glutaredoxin
MPNCNPTFGRRGPNAAGPIPQETPMPVLERIQSEIEAHPIVLFMKGTPQFPMCGFSSRTSQALKAAGATDYHTINVLEDPEIINGELIGGCDITLELYESGELARMIAEAKKA